MRVLKVEDKTDHSHMMGIVRAIRTNKAGTYPHGVRNAKFKISHVHYISKDENCNKEQKEWR